MFLFLTIAVVEGHGPGHVADHAHETAVIAGLSRVIAVVGRGHEIGNDIGRNLGIELNIDRGHVHRNISVGERGDDMAIPTMKNNT